MKTSLSKNETNTTGVVPRVSLEAGPYWSSFEKFRVQGSDALQSIQPGTVGTIVVKDRPYRVIGEEDFQHLLGLAREIDRVRQGMRVLQAAVRTVQQHGDESSVETLVEATLLLGDLPTLPVRSRFDPLRPEAASPGASVTVDEDDEVELNPAAIQRPYARGDRK